MEKDNRLTIRLNNNRYQKVLNFANENKVTKSDVIKILIATLPSNLSNLKGSEKLKNNVENFIHNKKTTRIKITVSKNTLSISMQKMKTKNKSFCINQLLNSYAFQEKIYDEEKYESIIKSYTEKSNAEKATQVQIRRVGYQVNSILKKLNSNEKLNFNDKEIIEKIIMVIKNDSK